MGFFLPLLFEVGIDRELDSFNGTDGRKLLFLTGQDGNCASRRENDTGWSLPSTLYGTGCDGTGKNMHSFTVETGNTFSTHYDGTNGTRITPN